MMHVLRILGAGLIALVVTLPANAAGPSEIGGLQEQLQRIEADIAATQAELKETLGVYGASAGDLGIRLRELKREHETVKQQLKVAVDAQTQREAADHAMPAPQKPSFESTIARARAARSAAGGASAADQTTGQAAAEATPANAAPQGLSPPAN
jgi:septal ring factor EnvC (AmiA/AmiB activator)